MEELEALLSMLPGYGKLTTGMKQSALDRSLIPDSNGVWPGEEGYVTTYDIYFAAYSLVGFLRAQPQVSSASSEGTSISSTVTDWDALALFYQGQSSILQGTTDVLRVVPIPDVPHVRRTDMSGRWDASGDVNTDIS